MRRKTFTHKFKQEYVNQVLQHNYPVTQAAETMDIGLSTRGVNMFMPRWMRRTAVGACVLSFVSRVLTLANTTSVR